uniref:Si:ch211-113d22.2 n=1 Tax=Salmo trutta TaxID=8032 RepID=A0A674C8C4_SALTR
MLLSLISDVLSCSMSKGHALKCHSCVASNEGDCIKQGSTTCPQFADACSTITGQNTVMKSCSYKAFCDKARNGNSGAKMECCFSDDCNGPHKGHRHGEHNNTASGLGASPALLLGALMLRMALSRF